MPTLTLVQRPGVRYLGGKRFGAWTTRGLCSEHRDVCSGVTWGGRFVEIALRGRTFGVCW